MALLGKFYTLFDYLRGIAICRPQKSRIGPNIFCLKANGKGLIIGFEIFGFGPSKPELWPISFVPKNVNLPHFFPLLGKILVLRVLPAYRKKIGCFPLNPPAPAARGGYKAEFSLF